MTYFRHCSTRRVPTNAQAAHQTHNTSETLGSLYQPAYNHRRTFSLYFITTPSGYQRGSFPQHVDNKSEHRRGRQQNRHTRSTPRDIRHHRKLRAAQTSTDTPSNIKGRQSQIPQGVPEGQLPDLDGISCFEAIPAKIFGDCVSARVCKDHSTGRYLHRPV